MLGKRGIVDERLVFATLHACKGTPKSRTLRIKCVDIGHSFKPWGQHQKWTSWVAEEFYLLGDRERELSGPEFVSPMCDRQKDSGIGLLRNQVGFFNFICVPFYKALAYALPASKPIALKNCQANLERWIQRRREAEEAEAAAHSHDA